MSFKKVLLACSALGFPAYAATAQPPAPAEAASAEPARQADQGIGEIVVTARRLSESVQSIPVAVTALSGKTLQAMSVRNIQDLAAVAPNVTLPTSTTDPTGVVVAIRGQRQAEQLLTIDPAVGVYVDEVNFPRPGGLKSALVDIARVEVLRGPQGTLYGRNTTGGAFSIITQDPKKDFGASLSASYGNYNAYEITGVVNIPLGDHMGIRTVAQYSDRDGYGHDALGRDLGNQRLGYIRSKFVGTFGDVTIKLSGDYSNIKTNGLVTKLAGINPATSTLPAGGTATREIALELYGNTSAASLASAAQVFQTYVTNSDRFYDTSGTFPSKGNYRGGGAGLVADWGINDILTLKSISGFRTYKRYTTEDLDSTPFNVLHPIQPTREHFYSQEVQLQGKLDHLTFVFGGYGSIENGKENYSTISLPSITAGALTLQDAKVINRSAAIYGQANWEFVHNLTLTLGGRYTSEDRLLDSKNRSTNGTCNVPVSLRVSPTVCEGDFKNTFSKPSWLASLDYKFTPDILVYAKLSTGFRSGGQQLRGTGTVAAFTPFKPENVTEYETGIKATLFNRMLRVNLAGYYDKYNDIQRSVIQTINNVTASIFTNAAKADLSGVEAEVDLHPMRGLDFFGSAGYLHAKYKQFTDLSGDRTGESWPTPDLTYTIGARYTTPVDWGDVSGNVSYTGQSAYSLRPEAKNQDQVHQGAYGLLNARLGSKITRLGLEVSLFGRNIANKKYNDTAIGIESLGFNIVIPGQPRTWGVQLTKTFGSEND